jgi:hypothetical protein
MQDVKLKPAFPGGVQTPEQSAEAVQSLTRERKQRLRSPAEARTTLAGANPMLLVEKLTGAILGGTAVTVLVGNILICVFMLLLGPTFIVELLAR